MHVTFLVPDIHDRPTGGNIYNRRVITELQGHIPMDVTLWPSEDEAQPSIEPPEDAVLVLDSLLLRPKERLQALRDAHPTATLILLAHYLHCIDPNEQNTPTAAIERDMLSLFDGVVVTSCYSRRALKEEGVPGSQIKVAPPGLDPAYRAPIPERPIRDAPRLLTVANLLPGKGLRALVEALTSVPETAWTWTLVGDDGLAPSFADALHEYIEATSIADRVTCTGALPTAAVQAAYDRADVFISASPFETCGMATREAMARGLPILGCDVGGLPENLGETALPSDEATPGDNAVPSGAGTFNGAPAPSGAPAGRLVPPNHPGALTDALHAFLTEPTARKRMGRAARERSRVFPTWPETADRVHAALRTLRSVDEPS